MKSAIIRARSISDRPPPDHQPANDNDPPEPPPAMGLRIPSQQIFNEVIAHSRRRHLCAVAAFA